MDTLKDLIAKLPEPTIFMDKKIEAIIEENVKLLKSLYPDWIPIESDSNMMQIEAFSYKELALRSIFNNAIKQMLPHYSKDENLDNFAFGFYGGELRLLGTQPSADYEFFLEEVLSVDIIIPKGFVLSDGANTSAYLENSLTIKSGTLSAIGKVKLDEKIKQSQIKTEVVISPYPYVLKPVALSDFEGGSTRESDEEFLQRAILSLNKYSTAGGRKAYEYFTYLADERVLDVKVLSSNPVQVEIVVKASNNINDVIEKVDEALNGDEKVQAFCDVVTVRAATPKIINLTPTIYLIDLLAQDNTNSLILKNFEHSFKIGESLPYSKIIKALEVSNVYKVELPILDLDVLEDEVLNITVTPTFMEASL